MHSYFGTDNFHSPSAVIRTWKNWTRKSCIHALFMNPWRHRGDRERALCWQKLNNCTKEVQAARQVEIFEKYFLLIFLVSHALARLQSKVRRVSCATIQKQEGNEPMLHGVRSDSCAGSPVGVVDRGRARTIATIDTFQFFLFFFWSKQWSHRRVKTA